ncbi:hypothetical protein B0T10DRAFT_193637 [Thelonectria olida]|uniref:Zn(2)-C6 fungal-type domain-containing protein n=1 Tax=Thelonectria olida TaxID=1576542 RepID=A0A9P8VV78_9HYPO|nr:hypothetical protein B0T10DRAFT_193637 [Thelonectria olida]
MFVTLKAAKTGTSDGVAMEQVAQSNASACNRFGRRVACMGCRSKKLRCMGSRLSCDRCNTQGIPCVPSSSRSVRDRASTRRTGSRVCQPKPSDSINDDSHYDARVQESDVTLPTPPRLQSDEEPGSNDGQTSHPVDPGTGNQPEPRTSTHRLGLGGPNLVDEILGVDLEASPPWGSASDTQTDDSAMTRPIFSPASRGVPVESGLTRPTGTIAYSGASEQSSTPAIPRPAPCSCLEDMLEIVQKLDDDEFKLKSLGFDEVLKLQKFMIFHCCKPLDCTNCMNLPSSSTVILIICERITEMFRCLSRRIKRQLPDRGGPNALNDKFEEPGFTFHHPLSNGQALDEAEPIRLFDGFSSEPSIRTPCNPDMFSPEFKAQYSYEEQLHMIRVLAKIQVRNANQLLLRIGEMHQSQRSQARFGKILDLVNRLQQAAESIDNTFQILLQNLVE